MDSFIINFWSYVGLKCSVTTDVDTKPHFVLGVITFVQYTRLIVYLTKPFYKAWQMGERQARDTLQIKDMVW